MREEKERRKEGRKEGREGGVAKKNSVIISQAVPCLFFPFEPLIDYPGLLAYGMVLYT